MTLGWREGRRVSDRPEVIILDWRLLIKGGQVGPYRILPGGRVRILTSPRLLLLPFSEFSSLVWKYHLLSLLPGFLPFPPSAGHSQVPRSRTCLLSLGKPQPSFLFPADVRQGAGVPHCQSHGFWLQKKPLDSGVLPLSLGPYLPHHLSLFFPPV